MIRPALRRLADKTALITGSTSGIGRAIAEAFAAEGATVVVTGRRAEQGNSVVAGIREAEGAAEFVPADLADGARQLADEAAAVTGRVDILVNNAALLMPMRSTPETTEEVMDQAYKLNIKAPFVLTAALAPQMASRGHGVVLNVGSVNAHTGLAGTAFYSATKAAVESFTRTWAAEFGRYGVRVNAIVPGGCETDWNIAHLEHFGPMLARTASGRLSRLSELGAAAVFLASDEASNLHGVSLPVDGGYLALSRVTGNTNH